MTRLPSVSLPLSPTVWIFTAFFDEASRSGAIVCGVFATRSRNALFD